ncbi:MAG: diguanylate cyclase, partial [Chloroflexi bacterium]|nr:diguanylate cyclase [Chloroflexota bacterium]
LSIAPEPVLRVLIVEDSRDQAAGILRALRDSGFRIGSRRVETAGEVLAALESLKWDLVVSAERLSALTAECVVRLLENSAEHIPCVVISDAVSSNSSGWPNSLSASAMIPRGDLTQLAPAVRQELRVAEIHRECRQLGEKSLQLAWYDRTTGLPGRPLFTDRLQVALTQARSRNGRLAVMLLHLSRTGIGWVEEQPDDNDRLIYAASISFRRCIRAEDSIGRWGPHEFILLFQDLRRVQEAERIASKLLNVAGRPLEVRGRRVGLTGSIGVALYPDHAQGLRSLVGAATAAMGATRGIDGSRYRLADSSMASAVA